jgi:hypothetical protein
MTKAKPGGQCCEDRPKDLNRPASDSRTDLSSSTTEIRRKGITPEE